MVLVQELNSCSSEDEIENDQRRFHRRNACKDDNRSQHQERSNNSDPHSNSDNNTEILLKLIKASKKFTENLNRILQFIWIDLGGSQIFDRLSQWCVQHPQMAICSLAAVLVAALPMLMFLAFVLSTIFMSATGFLVFAGTLLMILVGLLASLGVILLVFALIGLVTYYGVSHIFELYGITETLRNSSNTHRNNANSNTSQATREENVN